MHAFIALSFLAAATTCALFGAGLYSLAAPAKAQELIGRSATLGGRKVQCNNAQIIVDYTLPSEGAADDESVILNPDMLNGRPETVRIFVFKHECGHLTVGGSELAADCFAVHQGVREQWLDRNGLDQVCASLDGEPQVPIPTPPPNADAETSISVTSKRWRSSVRAIRSRRPWCRPQARPHCLRRRSPTSRLRRRRLRLRRHRRHPLLPNRPS